MSPGTLSGRVWVFGDRVSIEYISPLRYMFQPEGRGAACLKFLDREFAAADKQGDLIVAGSHFGQGPGHDHAVLAIREAGIAGIVARSFGPQFLRHSVVHALPVATCDDILERVSPGQTLAMDFSTGAGCNTDTGMPVRATVPEGIAAEILRGGGLIPYLRGVLDGTPA